MNHWQGIRDAANDLRREVLAALGEDPNELQNAGELIGKITEHLDLVCIPEHQASANLRGAMAVVEDDCVYFNNSLPKWYRHYCVAHEVAHFKLHHRSVHCSRSDIEDFSGDEESARTAEAAVGYGAGERREREANLFALELLLPASCLREAFVDRGLMAGQIAKLVEMPVDVIAGQLSRAVLVPAAERKTDSEPRPSPEPDQSQKAAARSDECPLLVSAGPGTGKTQTLTARISYLLEKGVDPLRILALTFSNKAADEIRERVELRDRDAAARMQIMTFHAFGLDVLRRYWQEAGLEPASRLLDRIDAVLHLERHLVEIDLKHYQQLHEPTLNLTAILSAISRAKDELCGPEKYKDLAEAMLETAEDDESRIRAEKVLETARVYEFYQRYLDGERLLDFGDLIFKAVRLLQRDERIRREMQGRYDAILVDEFQDVNRACGVLLKEVAGDGKTLWAVGDLRQSIYRWRGASPANIRSFDRDFPNAGTSSLEVNYRSRAEIIDLFARFAETMKAGGEHVFSRWQPHRGKGTLAAVTLALAPSVRAEGEEIARLIREHHAAGVAFREQAIICRTHNHLKKFAEVLADEGIPSFYLGDMFERDEVRDLLSLLDLRGTPNGFALLRVARFPEYDVPLEDVQRVIAELAAGEMSVEDAIASAIEKQALTAAGEPGLRKLLAHLTAISADASAWKFLVEYLFDVSGFLRQFLNEPDVNKRSRLLAIHQFLRFAESMDGRFDGDDRVQEFLRHVRTLSWFGEDKNYSRMPPAAESLDAVRLITVHSAKGLEFPVVYLPYLGSGKFPNSRQHQTCPDPTGMIESEEDHHDEEEECLFFVAMSRARDHLHLSRASRYGRSNSNPSRFLETLKDALPPEQKITGERDETDGVQTAGADDRELFYFEELNAYLECPRKYYYSYILGLRREDEKTIFLKFHSCVHDTIESLEAISRIPNLDLDEATALARLDEFWSAAEIDPHPYAPIYRKSAESMIRSAVRLIGGITGEVTRPRCDVPVRNGLVRVRSYPLEKISERGTERIVIRKYKSGKAPADKPKPGRSEPMVMHAAKLLHPAAEVVFEMVYLNENAAMEMSATDRVIKSRVADCEWAIDRIRAGQFPPKASDRECSRCSHFFVCPSGE